MKSSASLYTNLLFSLKALSSFSQIWIRSYLACHSHLSFKPSWPSLQILQISGQEPKLKDKNLLSEESSNYKSLKWKSWSWRKRRKKSRDLKKLARVLLQDVGFARVANQLVQKEDSQPRKITTYGQNVFLVKLCIGTPRKVY